jgi:hypothetical protein
MPALNLTLTKLNDSASRVFTAVGNYGYHCGIHTGDPVCRTGMGGSCTSYPKEPLQKPASNRDMFGRGVDCCSGVGGQ